MGKDVDCSVNADAMIFTSDLKVTQNRLNSVLALVLVLVVMSIGSCSLDFERVIVSTSPFSVFTKRSQVSTLTKPSLSVAVAVMVFFPASPIPLFNTAVAIWNE
mgnify:CR=1 FL=1